MSWLMLFLCLSGLQTSEIAFQSAEYQLELAGKNSVKMNLRARVYLAKGTRLVRVCGREVALSSASIDGTKATPFVRDDGVFLLLPGTGTHEIDLTGFLSIKVGETPRRVTIDAMRCAVMTVRFKPPSTALDVTVTPSVSTRQVTEENQTYIVANLMSTDSITVQWQEKVIEEKVPAVIYADCNHRFRATRSGLSGSSEVRLDIIKGTTASVRLEFERGVSILSVRGKGVRDWQSEQGTLTVYFDGDRSGEVTISITYELPLKEIPATVTIPVFRVAGVKREQGNFSITSARGIVPTLISLENAKQGWAGDASTQQFSYALASARATFRIEEPTKLDVRLYAEILGLIAVGDAAEYCTAIIKYSIFGAPINELTFLIPAKATVKDVVGRDIVSTSIEEGERSNVVTVSLENPVKGDCELLVRYEKLQPETSDRFEIPFVTVPDAVVQNARFGICAVTNAEVAPVEMENIKLIPERELPARVHSYAETPIILALKYSTSPRLILSVRRHEEIATTDMVVDLVESTSVLTPEGTVVTRELYIVRNRGRQFLSLEFDRPVSVWALQVAGVPKKPAYGGERKVLIPLIRSARSRNTLVPINVEIIHETTLPPLGWRGRARLSLPKVDATVSVSQWAIYTPSEFKFKVKKTNMSKFNPLRTEVIVAEGVWRERIAAPFLGKQERVEEVAPPAAAKPFARFRRLTEEKKKAPSAGARADIMHLSRRAKGEGAVGETLSLRGTSAGTVAMPVPIAVEGNFRYFRKIYPNYRENPPFVEFGYSKGILNWLTSVR